MTGRHFNSFWRNPDYQEGSPVWERLNPVFAGVVVGILVLIVRLFLLSLSLFGLMCFFLWATGGK